VIKKLTIFILLTLFSINNLNASDDIKKLIGNMFMVGFFGTHIDENSQIVKDIKEYHLGGVILFNKNPTNSKKAKNIKYRNQLKSLTFALQKESDYKLLIAVDQEGGRVQRLSPKNGFSQKYKSASSMVKKSDRYIKNEYSKMAKELKSVGINFNLAPVVDLAINPKNRVIVKLGRSFGKMPEDVVKYSTIFIKEMANKNILTSLKHFPGHGSSLGDTHKGFVDITKTWQDRELEPYQELIDSNMVDSIMVAHVINGVIDKKYPSSLSKKTITNLLRGQFLFNGVVISDDLQMRAISKHYSLKDTIKLSINAGVDILLFGNQLDPTKIVSVKTLVDTVYELYQSNEITLKQIKMANQRIDKLKNRL